LILATVLVVLTGCPIGPTRMLTVTDISPEYAGSFMVVIAIEPSDNAKKYTCGGIMVGIGDGNREFPILDLGIIAESEIKGAMQFAMAKSNFGLAKFCDSKEQIITLISNGYDTDDFYTLAKNYASKFIYTKGIDVCEIETGKIPTYSFSETKSILSFKDFMRASDCEIPMPNVVYRSKSYTVKGIEYKVHWYEANPKHIMIDKTDGTKAADWARNKKYGTNAGLFAPPTKNLVTFHIYNGNHIRGRSNNMEKECNEEKEEKEENCFKWVSGDAIHPSFIINFEGEIGLSNISPFSSIMYLADGTLLLSKPIITSLADGRFILSDNKSYLRNNGNDIYLKNVIWGIGGFDLFIDNESIVEPDDYIKKFKNTYKEFPIDAHRPRTAICYRDDKRVILATFFKDMNKNDERIANDAGPSFFEVREIMKELGCTKALMLDGGGSSQISFNNNNYIITEDRDPLCRIRIKDGVEILWQE